MMVGDWRFGTDFSHAEDDRLEGVLVLFFEVCRFTFCVRSWLFRVILRKQPGERIVFVQLGLLRRGVKTSVPLPQHWSEFGRSRLRGRKFAVSEAFG